MLQSSSSGVSASDLLDPEPWSECSSSNSKLSNSGTSCVFMASAISPIRNIVITPSTCACIILGVRNVTRPKGGLGGPASPSELLLLLLLLVLLVLALLFDILSDVGMFFCFGNCNLCDILLVIVCDELSVGGNCIHFIRALKHSRIKARHS